MAEHRIAGSVDMTTGEFTLLEDARIDDPVFVGNIHIVDDPDGSDDAYKACIEAALPETEKLVKFSFECRAEGQVRQTEAIEIKVSPVVYKKLFGNTVPALRYEHKPGGEWEKTGCLGSVEGR